jgi:hypothetical protein
MEKYRYGVDDKCRYNLYLESCSRCLFENLCMFEKNQDALHSKENKDVSVWQETNDN